MEAILLFLIRHFPDLMDVNLTASIVIIFVICVRQFLKGAPKIFSYALWSIVLLRLLVPVSIESPVSFVPERTEFSSMVEINEVLPEIQFETPQDRVDNEWQRETTLPGEPLVQTYRTVDAETYLTFAWLTGIAGMLLYSAVSYWKLRRKVSVCVPLRKGIFMTDAIDTPFVMGIFRPAIYLPSTLEAPERKYIIAHERHHIRRGDHIFKALGFLALTIHWFNPLVWVAFALAGRDMEMSCDEAVIQKLGEHVRAEYSASLLTLATGRRLFAGTPLAFGEDDPAGRVRNLAKWKKPAIWVIVICILVCVILAVCLLTDPGEEFDWSITRQEGPSCALGDFNYNAPDGMAVQGMEIEHDGNAWDYGQEFYVGDTLVGGVALRYQDSENDPEPFTDEWEKTIGVPEALDEGMGYIGSSSSYADFETTYFPDLPVNYNDAGEIIPDENGKYVIENEVTHYFFLNGDDVYDLWLYVNRLSEDMQIELLKSVSIQPPIGSADADATVITLNNDPLPDGYFEDRDEDGNMIFTDGTNTVGGVFCYLIPEGIYDPDDHIEALLYKMGIPDYMDTTLYFRGGMTSGDNGWLAEFESEVSEGEEPTVYRRHHFYHVEDVVYDIWFDLILLDYETAEEIRVCVNLPVGESAEEDWRVTLVPDRVSRTGATALFAYGGSVPDEEGAELTYDDFLSLERLVDGNWVACDELVGYDYYVGDSSYPVADGYGMVHEWQDRFGELADGHYRMGKRVTLTRPDGSQDSQMIYGMFTLPDAIQTGPIPLEDLPEKYGAEQAMIDGCFVLTDGVARENKERFHQFAEASYAGEPSFIRIVDWHYGDNSYYEAYDLEYDGTLYTISWIADGQHYSREFPYLKHFVGENEGEEADYDAYEHYVLTHDAQLTWDVWGELTGSHANTYADHMTVYSDYTYLPKKPQLPATLTQATLKFRGDEFATTTDFDRLEKLYLLFSEAEFLGYEPKTHSIGVMLDLILTTADGKTVAIELDPDNDLCRIGGEYVFYGKADEPCYIEKLWYYLDIPAWPDAVYEYCENAFRLQGVG